MRDINARQPARTTITALVGFALTFLLFFGAGTGAALAEPYQQKPFACSGGYNGGSYDDTANHTLYIACGSDSTIYRVKEGVKVAVTGALGYHVSDVAPSPDGKHLYAARGNQTPVRLDRNGETGMYTQSATWKLGPYPMDNAGWNITNPTGTFIATDAPTDGRGYSVYLAEGGWSANSTGTVVKYTPGGSYITRLGQGVDIPPECRILNPTPEQEATCQGVTQGSPYWDVGRTYWQLNGMAVSRDGKNVYTVEGGNNRVQRFLIQDNGTYAYASKFGSTSANDPSRDGGCNYTGWNQKFASPYDVGIDGAGNLYVVNTTCNEVVKFTGSEAYVLTSGNLGGGWLPHGLAVSYEGDVYIGQSQTWMDNTAPTGGANTAPTITNVEPADGAPVADGKPLIKAKVSDAEQNLVEANTKLFLDGAEIPVERRAYDDATDTLSHAYDGAQPLPVGNHTIKVEATDGVAATPTVKTWTFNVPQTDGGGDDGAVTCSRWASATGSNANSGATAAAPVRNVTKLMSILQPGETGCLKGGETFREGSGGFIFPRKDNGVVVGGSGGTVGAPIIVRTEPGKEKATVMAQVGLEESAQHIVFSNLNFRGDNDVFGPYLKDGMMRPGRNLMIIDGSYIGFRNSDISWPGGICASTGQIDTWRQEYIGIQSKGVVFDGNRIHDCGTDPRIEWQPGDSGSHAVYLQNDLGTRFTNNLVYGNKWRGLQIYPRSQDAVVKNNVFDNNATQINIGSALGDGCAKWDPVQQKLVPAGYCTWASSGAKVSENIFSNPSGYRPDKNESQVFGNFPSNVSDKQYQNAVTNNCFFPEDTGEADSNKNFGGYGYEHYGNKFGNPLYATPTGDKPDFTLTAGTACAGMGPQDDTNVAPTIADLLPADQSSTTETRPRLSATVRDDAPLSKDNIHLRVDGNLIGNTHYAYSPDTGSLWREFEPQDVSFPYGTHKVEIAVTDAQGKTASQTNTFRVVESNVDTTAPTGTITVKGGADYSNVMGVTLTLTATDNAGGTGVKEMRFKNGDGIWTEWEPYNTTKAWTLRNVQGAPQNVHAQFRDGNNIESLADTDSITLDTVKPKVGSVLPGSTNRVGVATSAVAYFPTAEKIPLENLNQNTFYLRVKGTTTTKVAVKYRYDETQAQDRAILTPLKSLQRNKTYQVVMNSGVKDAAGNALDQDPNTAGWQGKVWYFTTQV